MMTTSVIAARDISEGTSSLPGVGPIDLKRLFEKKTSTVILHVDIRDNHLHVTELQSEKEWARHIAIAKNCHEQNLEITNTPNGLILRTIRNIKAKDELFVWVGSDLLSKLEFPFLKPSNIRGNQAYHCHRCGSIFEDPNPLKVHLSFLCKSLEIPFKEFPVDSTWDYNTVDLFPCDAINTRKIPIINRKYFIFNEQLSYVQPVLCSKNFSADNDLHSRSFTNVEITMHDTGAKQPVLRQSSDNVVPSVSNNYRSDGINSCSMSQGHICSFCGKVYSRKYGLKIHVRTHTGYKPLKCKYCFRPFSDPSNLNKHVRLHSESDAPYRCLKCGKVLVRRRDLERHMKSRHPEVSHKTT